MDRSTFEVHIADLHRCLTCPINDHSMQAVESALARVPPEKAQECPQEAAGADELWPGTNVPRNQPIWPGIGYSKRLDLSEVITAAAMSAGASMSMRKRKEEGTDNTVVKGLSKKSEERNRVLPAARMVANKKPQK